VDVWARGFFFFRALHSASEEKSHVKKKVVFIYTVNLKDETKILSEK
jgi:hypothetical protein